MKQDRSDSGVNVNKEDKISTKGLKPKFKKFRPHYHKDQVKKVLKRR